MATAELVAFTTGTDDSGPQQAGQGEVHTLYPVFQGSFGKVTVSAVLSDGSEQLLTTLSSRPASNKMWQVQGPVEYIVRVRNAGCDVDTGA